MILALIIWNAILTAGLAYVIGGYLYHINVTHPPPDLSGDGIERR